MSNFNGKTILVTGGAGFLGSNTAYDFLSRGHNVTILDNFSRGEGCYQNLKWLQSHPNAVNLRLENGDVRNHEKIHQVTGSADVIIHAAAQTSVPISVNDPHLDFETNVTGTFNVLEGCRKSKLDPILIYIGSNKVYGATKSKLVENATRYDFDDLQSGIDENFPIDPLEPYGASKACAEMYVKTYHQRYGLRSATIRFSLLYGLRQWGTEEQGFVTWFCIANALNLPINIFGNGKQVRDILYSTDAVSAINSAIKKIEMIAGNNVNIGGGKENSISLMELLDFLNEFSGKETKLIFKPWRDKDVSCFYTDNRRASELLGWKPTVQWKTGVKNVFQSVSNNLDTIRKIYLKS